MTFAPGHPSIARSQSNLALVLQDLGQFRRRRADLLSAALAANEQSFPPGHPSIAGRQSNLATVCYKIWGQLAEARDLLEKALASYEQTFAAGHPSIASAQSKSWRLCLGKDSRATGGGARFAGVKGASPLLKV